MGETFKTQQDELLREFTDVKIKQAEMETKLKNMEITINKIDTNTTAVTP